MFVSRLLKHEINIPNTSRFSIFSFKHAANGMYLDMQDTYRRFVFPSEHIPSSTRRRRKKRLRERIG